MASRPIFVPVPSEPGLVREIYFSFAWNPGFAPSQKKKNINVLHDKAAAAGYAPLLEISTKSEEKVGQHLSAFHLKVKSSHLGEIPLECAFQGSKIFEFGGPYIDLYSQDARSAKQDPRLQNSGKLIGFKFNDRSFPLEPKTVFYDWLYVNAIFPHRDWLKRLSSYAGFTDIEFNPEKSINCQARSCALFVSLSANDLLEKAVHSQESFIDMVSGHSYHIQQVGENPQGIFFAK